MSTVFLDARSLGTTYKPFFAFRLRLVFARKNKVQSVADTSHRGVKQGDESFLP